MLEGEGSSPLPEYFFQNTPAEGENSNSGSLAFSTVIRKAS